jgi:hypothetical protein
MSAFARAAWGELTRVLSPHLCEAFTNLEQRKAVIDAFLKQPNRVLERVCRQASVEYWEEEDEEEDEATVPPMYTLFTKSLAHIDTPLVAQIDVQLASRQCHNDAVLQLESGSAAMTVSALSNNTMAQWFRLNGALTSVSERSDPTSPGGASANAPRRSRYLAMPCYYAGMDGAAPGHMSALLFDHRTGSVFLLDPNGSSSFFQADLDKARLLVPAVDTEDEEEEEEENEDSEFEQLPEEEISNHHHTSISQQLVEDVLRDYCRHLSQGGGGQWTYESQASWNPYGLCINSNIATSQVGNGYCVVTTLMLLHTLELTQQTPDLVGGILVARAPLVSPFHPTSFAPR